MTIKQVITEGEKPVKVWTDEIDALSRTQLVNLSKLPFIHRHVAADLVEHLLQHPLVELLRGQRGARGGHAAADIDADGGRDDGAIGGNDAADGGADAGVHVRHRGDVPMDER